MRCPPACVRGSLAAALALASTSVRAAEPPSPDPPAGEAAPPRDEPWRLAEAAGAPEWLHVALEHRTRYGHLFDHFRSGRPGDGGMLSFRTSLLGELRLSPVRVGAELLDARTTLDNEVTVPNTGHVNAVSLLQAYVAVDAADLAEAGDGLEVKAGRLTIDLGGRRLVARNNFRNTINGFTGLDATYGTAAETSLRVFAVLPIQRLPNEPERVRDDEVVFDRESFDVVLAGAFLTTPLPLDLEAEVYAIGLGERDGPNRPTRNRRLLTPGLRLHRLKARGELDVEVELMVQYGRSRASSDPGDTTDLRHLAVMQHAAIGYTLPVFADPRLVLEYDHASGDADPRDDQNNRFDTLYGARRFELGPTGIYGAFARSNIRSPGLRLQAQPLRVLRGFVGYRAFWLGEARDTWTTAQIRDSSGASGAFVGHQLEGRLRFDPWPKNLRIEIGAAHLFPGSFLARAPDANPDTDTTMLYTQLIGRL